MTRSGFRAAPCCGPVLGQVRTTDNEITNVKVKKEIEIYFSNAVQAYLISNEVFVSGFTLEI